MALSTSTIRQLQRVDDTGGVLVLLTINEPSFVVPVRIVNDTRDVVSNGNTFLALPFAITLPNDLSREVPRVQLQIDNVGRDLTAELEALAPGAALNATVQVVHRFTPDVIDYEFTAPLINVRVDQASVQASMGPTDLLRRAAVALRFDPGTAPGLFAG